MVTRKMTIRRHKPVKTLLMSGILVCFTTAAGHAATQGSLGYSSSATIALSVTIHPLIRVSGVEDIQLDATQGESVAGTSAVCVGGTYGGEYAIEAQGSGAGEAFVLRSGDDTLGYAVSYSDPSGTVELQPATGVGDKRLASSIDCAAGDNARLTISVDGEQSSAAPPGVYNGTLTLLVSPQ